MRIVSDFANLHQHLADCYSHGEERGWEPWQSLQELANPPEAMVFSSDEMGMLLSLGNADVFNSVLPIDMFHANFLNAFNRFFRLRNEITDRIPPVNAGGGVIEGVVDGELMRILQPRIMAANALADDMLRQSGEHREEAEQAMNALHALFTEKLGLTHRIEMVGPAQALAA